MTEDLKKQLDGIGDIVDSKIEKAFHQAQDNAKGEIESSLKSEISNLTNEYVAKHDAAMKRIDEVEIAQKKAFNNQAPATFKSSLTNAINDGAIDALRKGSTQAARFELKAGDMSMGASNAGNLIETAGMIARETVLTDYKFNPERAVHMRQLMPNGSTDGQQIRYAQETAFDVASIAMKAEGATLGQSDFTLTSKVAALEKLGTYMRVTEEMLNDTPQISSYISARVPQKVLNVEDDQILNGTGSTPEINGITAAGNHTAFNATTAGFNGAVAGANEYDVLVAALNQLALSNYQADTIIVNPTDLHKIALLKSSQNEYLRQQIYSGLQPQVMGINIVANTALASDKFLVGNFQTATQFWIRENLSVEFAREDGTNFRDGFVTVRVQERVAQTVYLPLGIIYGDFSDAKTAVAPTP